jgi:hypothetical protein
MAGASQIEESKSALDKVKNTMVEMENEIARLRDYVQTLEDLVENLKLERSANYDRLDAGERNRNRLMTISRKYEKYSSSTLGTFLDPRDDTYIFPPTRRQQLEGKWFEWAAKELQFATEMREVIKRVDGASTGASESAGSKRSFDESSIDSDFASE